jgi:hypothetical protein
MLVVSADHRPAFPATLEPCAALQRTDYIKYFTESYCTPNARCIESMKVAIGSTTEGTYHYI